MWIGSGVVAGWITGLVMKGRGYGVFGDLFVGLVGGLAGGWVLRWLGVNPQGASLLAHVVTAALGGMLLVGGVRLLRRL